MRQANHSLRTRGSRQADQGDVWRRVAEKAEALNVESRTGAMSDVFESRDGELQRYAQAFHALPRQVGAVFIVDDVARAVPDRFNALGEGEDLRITRPALVGRGIGSIGGMREPEPPP